ncbi:microtubule-associated protein Jupiter-like [Aethina tumida]|uniref:microtubule-associated protein Jupiter-like n=1 Tax=Aethina tumida TaxID=116153 RepID=UPI002148ACCE|nr:microtubule-associated protein Jupiter-like [Aethina tumida]
MEEAGAVESKVEDNSQEKLQPAKSEEAPMMNDKLQDVTEVKDKSDKRDVDNNSNTDVKQDNVEIKHDAKEDVKQNEKRNTSAEAEKETANTNYGSKTSTREGCSRVASNVSFADNEPQYTNSYIFSVNGAPSRRLRRPSPVSMTGHASSVNMLNTSDVVLVSAGRPQTVRRNPVTGTGVSSTDELSYRPKGRISARHLEYGNLPDVGAPFEKKSVSALSLKRPSTCFRNPVTGMGLNSIDEIAPHRLGSAASKDGNPLLGVGYDAKRVITDPVPSDRIHPAGYVRKGVNMAQNNRRIPPGGYSTKLW